MCSSDLTEVHDMIQRMRELAIQGSNDTLSSQDAAAINTELQQLSSEIDAIGTRTKFNGKSLLTGSLVTTLGGATGTDLVVNDSITNGGETSVVTEVSVNNAKANDTFTLSSSAAGTLTLTRGSDSVAQTVSVSALAANGTETLDFSTLGEIGRAHV